MQPIRPPELAELQTFVLAVEHGSISGAAQRLRISSTAATKRLNNLEVLARGRLLVRTNRGVRPTALGRRLLPAIERLLHDTATLLPRSSAQERSRLAGVHEVLRAAGSAASPNELLADIETLLAEVFRKTSDALLITDAAGAVIDANDAYCRQMGRKRQELLGSTVTGPDGLTEFETRHSLHPFTIGRLALTLIRVTPDAFTEAE